MKWTREQYLDLMTYNHPERLMFSELFGPLVGLEEEWRAQGATEEMIAMKGFSFDYVPFHSLGNFGAIHLKEPITLREDACYFEGTDHLGRHVRLDKRTATIPLPDTFPVETMDDWIRIKHMFLYEPHRLTKDDIAFAKKKQSEGTVITCGICGAFDILRELMGVENTCIAYYEDPELVFDILNTISATNQRLLEEICAEMTPDILCVHEDLAGKTGPLVGPNIVREFMKPYYRASWDIVNAAGTKLFSQDSDGNINADLDEFIDSGINLFNPCEPGADMDIVALRKKYGHAVTFQGGIDKHVLRRSKEEIKAEVEYRMQPCMMDGGVVFGLDHRIPNGTPLENYIYYVDLVREKLGLPDFRTEPDSWGRMAL